MREIAFVSVGVAVGLALGWLLFDKSPPPRRASLRAAAEAQPQPPSKPPVPKSVASENGEQPRAEEPEEPVAHEAWVATLDRARAEKDWPTFRETLKELGARNTPAADAMLVRVMADLTMRFPDKRMGQRFDEYLRGSKAAGIAAAARGRIAQAIEIGQRGRAVVEGWGELIAIYGSEDDIDWMLNLDEAHSKLRARSRSLEALTVANRPEVVERLTALLKSAGKGVNEHTLRFFMERHPPEAYEVLDTLVASADGRESESHRQRRLGDELPGLLADATTAELLSRTRDRLLAMRRPQLRMQAVGAVQRLADKKFDISGLEPILEWPIEILTRVAANGGKDETGMASSARRAIQYNRLLWNARSIGVLERAAAASPRLRARLLSAADVVRSHLVGEWKTD